MFRIRAYVAFSLLLICLVANGCGKAREFGKALGSLVELREHIMHKFGEDGVDVRINSMEGRSTLSINFINSTLNDKDIVERQKRALETAQFVKDHYADIKQVSEILIFFSRAKTALFIFHSVVVLDFHGFDNKGQPLPEFAAKDRLRDPDPTKPTTVYSESRNQTEIACGFIQLEGTPEHGVMVSPHFTVQGNINKVTPRPPAEVGFDFASFSEKQKFSDVTKISFVTDNKVSFQTEGQFSTSHLADGMVSEFLYLKVPSRAVLRITTGSEMTIQLGKNEYRLTPQQILSLQRMSDFLK
jgi:hypothetical protein